MGEPVRCPGKLNLFLELVARRPDGYHDLDSVVVEAPVADTLFVERDPGPGVRLQVFAHHPSAADLPVDERNLVVRAARAALRAAGRESAGLRIRLEKRIPLGAGLGGGSSDAAATLLAACDALDHEPGDGGLAAAAAALGSDVPYFLERGTARMEGRGERLTRERRAGGIGFLVLYPGVPVATADVYARCRVPGPGERRDPGAVLDALARGDAAALARACFNRLLEPALAIRPEIGAALRALERLGAGPAHMTGSGSACFVVLGGPAPDAGAIDRLLAAFPPGARAWVERAVPE